MAARLSCRCAVDVLMFAFATAPFFAGAPFGRLTTELARGRVTSRHSSVFATAPSDRALTGLPPARSRAFVGCTIPLRLPAPSTQPPQGPFPPAAFFVAAITGTLIPSDSLCAATDFAFGLYGAPCPDEGRADGSLEFRTSPCTRAAPRTPPGPDAHPDSRAL